MKLAPLALVPFVLAAACGTADGGSVAMDAPVVSVTSPAEALPADAACKPETIGAIRKTTTLVAHDNAPVEEVPSLGMCLPFFSQQSWSGWVSAHAERDFFGKPLRALHAAFLVVRDADGKYLTGTVVKLLEGQDEYHSVECYSDGHGMTQYQVGYARAAGTEAVVCDSFAGIAPYGKVYVTFAAENPTARFVPASGGPDVALTVHALRN